MSRPEAPQVPRRDPWSGDASRSEIAAFWSDISTYSEEVVDSLVDGRIDITLQELEASYKDPSNQLGRLHAELNLVLGGVAKARLRHQNTAPSQPRPQWLEYARGALLEYIDEAPSERAVLMRSKLYVPTWPTLRALHTITEASLNPDWYYDDFSFAAAVAFGKLTAEPRDINR
jgi:hypothetical protein